MKKRSIQMDADHKKWLELLEIFMDFSNADLAKKKGRQPKLQFINWLDTVSGKHSGEGFVKTLDNSDTVIKSLQDHLRTRLDAILIEREMPFTMPLWKVSGTIEVVLNPLTDGFHMRMESDLKRSDDIETVKAMLDLALLEMIWKLDLKPGRFRQCPRCKRYFYQASETEQIYCSINCGNAERMKRYRMEKKMRKNGDG